MIDILAKLKQAQEAAPVAAPAFVPVVEQPKQKEQDQYFVPDGYISRSELLQFEKVRKGKSTDRPPEYVFRFGTLLDCLLTEPHRFSEEYQSDCTDFELLQLLRCKREISHLLPYSPEMFSVSYENQEPLCVEGYEFQAIQRVELETPSGLVKLKAKADWVDFRYGCVYDLKTTTAANQEEFMKSVNRYQYDLQAAMYADIFGVENFKLIVVGYCNSNHVRKSFCDADMLDRIEKRPWIATIDCRKMIPEGREKYQRLIAEAIETGQMTATKKPRKRRKK